MFHLSLSHIFKQSRAVSANLLPFFQIQWLIKWEPLLLNSLGQSHHAAWRTFVRHALKHETMDSSLLGLSLPLNLTIPIVL